MQTVNLNQDYWTATAVATAASSKPTVTLCDSDGNVYQGHVNDRGAKHGQGTLKTGFYITGNVGDETSHGVQWTEFSGNWNNGLMHGYGVMREMFCAEPGGEAQVVKVVYDGMWDSGVRTMMPAFVPGQEDNDEDNDDDDHESETEYDDAYYEQMYAEEMPQRGDYDHSEEAS